MKAFEWCSATSVDEAVQLLGAVTAEDEYESPRPLAGGQDLLTAMKEYVVRPKRVVNLKTIPDLANIEGDGSAGLKIGPLVTLRQLEMDERVKKSFPGLAEAAHSIATVQLRNMGTVGGNLCQRPRCWYFRLEDVICLKKGGDTCYAQNGQNKYHAIFGGGPSFIVHPSDLATMLLALDATVTITGPKGRRDLALANFFVLPADDASRENVLENGELLTEIRVPASGLAARCTYLKFKERSSLDFAMSAVAAAVDMGPDKTVREARIVLGGVAPMPWRVAKAETALVGKTLDDKSIAAAAEIALDGATPLAQNGYKVPLTKALVRRALAKLNTMGESQHG
jgi:xanthine dehydrogenase YagS FAD-binding subunit